MASVRLASIEAPEVVEGGGVDGQHGRVVPDPAPAKVHVRPRRRQLVEIVGQQVEPLPQHESGAQEAGELGTGQRPGDDLAHAAAGQQFEALADGLGRGRGWSPGTGDITGHARVALPGQDPEPVAVDVDQAGVGHETRVGVARMGHKVITQAGIEQECDGAGVRHRPGQDTTPVSRACGAVEIGAARR